MSRLSPVRRQGCKQEAQFNGGLSASCPQRLQADPTSAIIAERLRSVRALPLTRTTVDTPTPSSRAVRVIPTPALSFARIAASVFAST